MKINIIPQPQYCINSGGFMEKNISDVGINLSVPIVDERLLSLTKSTFGAVQLPKTSSEVYAIYSANCVPNFSIARRVYGRCDGYVLITQKDSVEIYSNTVEGLFYGIKTLMQLQDSNRSIPVVTIVDWADLKLRSDYLDLRTIYPKFENILAYIKQISDYKLNTLVIEYEDKIPFPNLTFLANEKLAFTKEQFELLQDTAYENFIEIIPLQQTFGHLEYLLKYKPYIHLRETPNDVGEMCPHREGAFEIAAQLIEEMALLHPKSRYLHIGCDEVWSLGSCDDCRSSGMTREQSFINFANKLIDKTCSLGKIPLIWHDMICNAAQEEINTLDKRAVLCVWEYNGSDLKHRADNIIKKINNVGIEVIGCCAVRCWDCEGHQNYSLLQKRIQNIDSWHEVAQTKQLSGIINTNWASPFSLAKPYGLYETSIYPLFYAADHNWNFKANVNNYLERFLYQFHGIEDFEILQQGFDATDYYNIIPSLIPQVKKNYFIAKLIAVMTEFECPTKNHFPLSILLYRGEMFGDKKEEIESLKKKYEMAHKLIIKSKADMEEILKEFLCDEMAQHFLKSRFYLEELYEMKAKELIER